MKSPGVTGEPERRGRARGQSAPKPWSDDIPADSRPTSLVAKVMTFRRPVSEPYPTRCPVNVLSAGMLEQDRTQVIAVLQCFLLRYQHYDPEIRYHRTTVLGLTVPELCVSDVSY